MFHEHTYHVHLCCFIIQMYTVEFIHECEWLTTGQELRPLVEVITNNLTIDLVSWKSLTQWKFHLWCYHDLMWITLHGKCHVWWSIYEFISFKRSQKMHHFERGNTELLLENYPKKSDVKYRKITIKVNNYKPS